MDCTWRMTSSRIKRSEADNASEGNLGIVEMSAEGGDGAARTPLGLSGTIPAPAADVFETRTVKRVGKGGKDATLNCVCSVCPVDVVVETLHQPQSFVGVTNSGSTSVRIEDEDSSAVVFREP